MSLPLTDWVRSRILKDHHESTATERQIRMEIPKQLTDAELEEGLSL